MSIIPSIIMKILKQKAYVRDVYNLNVNFNRDEIHKTSINNCLKSSFKKDNILTLYTMCYNLRDIKAIGIPLKY